MFLITNWRSFSDRSFLGAQQSLTCIRAELKGPGTIFWERLNKCKVTIWYRHPENSKKMYGLKHLISFSSRYFMSRMSESSWLGPAASCSSSLPDSISSFLMRPISSSGSSLTSSSSSLEVFTFLQAQQPSTGNRILDLH